MRRLGSFVLAIAAAVALLLTFAPRWPAAASHSGAEFELSARPLADGAWLLDAQLRDRASRPIGSQLVRFSAAVEFLGARPVRLGAATTDASGIARLTYRPTWTGLQRIVARASFDDGTVVSNEAVLEVGEAATPIAPPAARLPVVGPWAGPVAAAVALSVWGLLALVLLRVVFGISRATLAESGGRPQGHGRVSKKLLGR